MNLCHIVELVVEFEGWHTMLGSVRVVGGLSVLPEKEKKDFCIGLNFLSGADFGLFYFHNLAERRGVRSHKACRMIADSEQIRFSDLSENLLSDKTDLSDLIR